MLRICLLTLALLSTAPRLDARPPDAAEVAAFAQAELKRQVADPDGPGMAVLVARGDTLLFRGARGSADLALKVPLSADHVFRIGSVTKQFAAAGLLALADQGKLRLDDPLSRFMPEYPGAEGITLAQLLNHTAGVPSYTSIPGYMDQDIRRDLSTQELVAVFKDRTVDFEPGSQWRYSNSGYVLIGAVIEAVSGEPWDRWLAKQQFEPLELEHTRGGATREVIPGHASGYAVTGSGVLQAAPLSMTQPHAAGALVSTVDDLWRWNRALHGGTLLSATSYARMITPEGAAAGNGVDYGFGVQIDRLRGQRLIEHGGGIHGFGALLLYLPDSGISVAVLRNANGEGGEAANLLARRLAAFALGDPYPDIRAVEVAEAELASVQGVYRLNTGSARTLRLKEGRLFSQRSGGSPFPLIPLGQDRFAFEGSLSALAIERDADGQAVAMRFFESGEGEGERWPRTDEPFDAPLAIELPRAALERLVGTYVSEHLSFRVFFDADDVLRVEVPGQPALALFAESEHRLFVREVDARFEFANNKGPANAATLVQGSNRIEVPRSPD